MAPASYTLHTRRFSSHHSRTERAALCLPDLIAFPLR
jgi:hypothetical protein